MRPPGAGAPSNLRRLFPDAFRMRLNEPTPSHRRACVPRDAIGSPARHSSSIRLPFTTIRPLKRVSRFGEQTNDEGLASRIRVLLA